MLKEIKRVLLFFIVNPYRRYSFSRWLKKEELLKREGNNLAFLIATPEHGNLGDQAIVISEIHMLEKYGFKNRIIEIKNTDYSRYKKNIHKRVRKDDLIIIDGGGNLGTLWPWEDDKIADIIYLFRRNPILIFPQTCFYKDDDDGKERLEKNKHIYGMAKDLTIALRDKSSFTFCKENFPSNVTFLLVPDIVFSLSEKIQFSEDLERHGVLLCFRNDLERVFDSELLSELRHMINSLGISCDETSTLVDEEVTNVNRDIALYNKLCEFRSAELIITDRLHAMIFAHLTTTPCIAFDNLSKKVSGVYDVAGRLSNIRIARSLHPSVDDIQKAMSEVEPYQTLQASLYENLINEIVNKIK